MDDHGQSVQYDGEYVLTRDGHKDFGEIPELIARVIGIPAGKIRLRIGKHEGSQGNYGQKHIERSSNKDNRLEQLKENGYSNARDLVEDVTQNFDAVYPGKFASLVLVKYGEKKDPLLCIGLEANDAGQFYDVKTGFVTRHTYFKHKKPLWRKP